MRFASDRWERYHKQDQAINTVTNGKPNVNKWKTKLVFFYQNVVKYVAIWKNVINWNLEDWNLEVKIFKQKFYYLKLDSKTRYQYLKTKKLRISVIKYVVINFQKNLAVWLKFGGVRMPTDF